MPVRHQATDGSVQDRSIGDTAVLHQGIWIFKLAYVIHILYYCHVNSTHMVNFMGIHKVIINIDSGPVPVRHQATVHTLCRWSWARLQHPCRKCTGDTAVQQQTIWMYHYELAYDTHMSHVLPFQCYTYGQFYGYIIRSS